MSELTELETENHVEEIEVEGKSDEVTGDWMDILGSGDLKKKVIKPGIVETRPKRGDTVRVNIFGKLEDATIVDKQDDLIFTIGDGEMFPGLDIVLPLMDKAEVCEAFMASRFVYMSKGLPPDIPSDADITYTITLIDFKPEDLPEDLSLEERLSVGNRKRERGNWWYNRGDYAQSVQCYKASVDFLDDVEDTYGEETPPETMNILNERLKAYNNMAAAQMKLDAYDVALKSLDCVLRCQPKNVKALFRKGKVLGIMGKLQESLSNLKLALSIEPESMIIHQELAKVMEKARKETSSEKALYRRMFGISGDSPSSKEPDRYPTLRGLPVKTLIKTFFVMLFLILVYKYRDQIGLTALIPKL